MAGYSSYYDKIIIRGIFFMIKKFIKISQFIDNQDDVLNTAEWESRYKQLAADSAAGAAMGVLGGPAAMAGSSLTGAVIGGVNEIAKSAWWKFLDSNEKKVMSNIDNALSYYAQSVAAINSNVHDTDVISGINRINSLLNNLENFSKLFIYEKNPYTDADIKKTQEVTKPKTDSIVCNECNGYKYISCPECHGSGKMPKRDSNGNILTRGEIMIMSSCERCKGSGIITCPKCQGVGKSAKKYNKFIKLSQEATDISNIQGKTLITDGINANKILQDAEQASLYIKNNAALIKGFKDYLEYIKSLPAKEQYDAIKFLQSQPIYQQYVNTDIVKNWWKDIVKESPDIASKFKNIINTPSVQNIMKNPAKTLFTGVKGIGLGLLGDKLSNVVIDNSELNIDGLYGYCKKRFDYTLAYLSSAYTILKSFTNNPNILNGFYTQCKQIQTDINNIEKKLYELKGNK